jgi:hypothetical protein
VSVYVVDVPATTSVSPSVLVISRSERGVTVTPSVATSSPGSGSGVSVVTDASLVSGPEPIAITTISIVSVAPSGSSPRSQVTVPAASEQAPAVVVTESKVTPAGRSSITSTSTAVDGPSLVTVRV